MSELFQVLYQWIEAHPGWAQVLLFLITCIDGLFIVGALVPAGIMLFAMGALVALGAVDLWTTALVAAGGALAGDVLSFILGWAYRERLFESRVFRRYPDLIGNGRRFFARHGGKSVVLARFLGPMRAIMPSLAGAAGMPIWYFLLADTLAALAWAFAYILPGMVFGASLGLAAEVAGRLALLIALLGFSMWVAVSVTLFMIRQMQAHADRWIGAWLDWSRRHRVLGRFGIALADPDQPETPVLAVVAVLLLISGGLWVYVWAAPALGLEPRALDVAVFQALRQLHTPWGMAVAQALLQFGEWPVYLPVALTAFLALLLARKPHAAAHWAAALGFAAVIALGLQFIPSIAPPFRHYGTLPPAGTSALDLVVATVIYTFLPVLLATGRSQPQRVAVYAGGVLLLLLTLLARLYLGAQWWSLAIVSVVLGGVWAALLGFGYRRHHPEPVSVLRFLLPVALVFVTATGWQWSDDRVLVYEPLPPRSPRVLSTADWAHHGYQDLRSQRQDLFGRRRQPFNLQWAGPLPAIHDTLVAAGWQDPTPLRAPNALRWLAPSTGVAQLPVLPQVHAGRHPVLVLRYPVGEQRQYLLRLWPTGYVTDQGQPIWTGRISLAEARSVYRLLRYPVELRVRIPLSQLLGPLPQTEVLGRGNLWRLHTPTIRP